MNKFIENTVVGIVVAGFIYPAFWIMIIGAILWLCGSIVMLGKLR